MNATAQSTTVAPRLSACPVCNADSPHGRKDLCPPHQATIAQLTAIALHLATGE